MRTESKEPLTTAQRLELANRLFQEYYAACFWHLKPDLQITEETIPLVVKGLRLDGGRRAFVAAEKLVK